MRSNHILSYLTLSTLILIAISGCNTTRNIYKSGTSKKDYVSISAVTLTHCGCTEIYAASFKSGKMDFQIFYNDHLARKTIYYYNSGSKTPSTTSQLAISGENFTIPFDSLDIKIFSIIDSAIVHKRGMIYPMRRTIYKGYIADTLLTR